MDREELEKRTMRFSLGVVNLVKVLPRGRAADVIASQVVRSGTSIGADYREATRAESRADFVHKLAVVLKEANETVYWLELIQESSMIGKEYVSPLLAESKELLAIFTASHKTARRR